MGLDTQWLLDVCRIFPEPDLTLVLDMDPRAVIARGHTHKPYVSGCDWGCSDEAFVRHQDKVRSHILALAKARGYTVIDADRPLDEVFGDLKQRLAPNLKRLAGVLPS